MPQNPVKYDLEPAELWEAWKAYAKSADCENVSTSGVLQKTHSDLLTGFMAGFNASQALPSKTFVLREKAEDVDNPMGVMAEVVVNSQGFLEVRHPDDQFPTMIFVGAYNGRLHLCSFPNRTPE